MAQIKNPTTVISGGSDVVNGIIEQYKAESGTIDANTFVEFVNSGTPGVGEDQRIVPSGTHDGGTAISAVLLPSGDVFIAHGSASGHGSADYLTGVVVSISGTTITSGADTRLSTTAYGGECISAVLLANGNVFIAHNGEGTGSIQAGSQAQSSRLYGIVVSISGTTITTGSDTRLSTTTYGGAPIAAAVSTNGNVAISHNGGGYYHDTSGRLYGVVVSISGTTITTGSDTRLSTTTYGAYGYLAIAMLQNDAGYISHPGNGSYLYGVVVSISGTTITTGSDTAIISASYKSYGQTATYVDAGKVFVTHSGDSNYTLNGIVCTVSGTSITIGTDTSIINKSSTAATVSTVMLNNGDMFIAHNHGSGSSNYLNGVVVSISGTTITAGSDKELSRASGYDGGVISAALLSNNNVLIAHSGTSYKLYGIVTDMSEVYRIRPATTAQNMIGLTAEDVTSSTAGDVWVLDTN